jgi:hypothetical protein
LRALLIFVALTPAKRARQQADPHRPRLRPRRPTGSSRLCGAAAADDVADSILVIAVRGDDGGRGVGATDDDDVAPNQKSANNDSLKRKGAGAAGDLTIVRPLSCCVEMPA